MSSNPKDSPWYSTPRNARKRRGVEVTLSDEARAKLDKLVKKSKTSRSAVVEALIMEAK